MLYHLQVINLQVGGVGDFFFLPALTSAFGCFQNVWTYFILKLNLHISEKEAARLM